MKRIGWFLLICLAAVVLAAGALGEETEVGEVMEEVLPASETEDGGLKLALDKEEKEVTIYAGGTYNHLCFVDIQDYETLEAVWGGTPGWLIMPEEGSEDVMRWSNASWDGKSIWAFYPDIPAREGDYTSVVTCTWHGQTASARIILHVIPSPTGAPEGLGGIESEYTMTLGDTLQLNIQPEPAGWTPPSETAWIRLSSISSLLESGYLNWETNGNPYFNITLSDGFGPASIQAWRSGVYEIEFTMTADNFEKEAVAKITVKNEDGSIPASAEEIQQLKEAAFAYELETDRSTGEQYAVITGCSPAEKIVIPSVIDGHTVRKITTLSRNRSNTGSGNEMSEKLKELTVSEGITIIERYAFQGLEALEKVHLPESLLVIEGRAFMDCPSLKEVNLPSGLKLSGIEEKAFSGVGMEDLKLADGTSLREVTASGKKDVFSIRYEDWCYVPLDGGTARLTDAPGIGYNRAEVEIPAEINGLRVTELGDNFMVEKSSVEKVVLPTGLESIGERAFSGLTRLQEINLPESLTFVGIYAFKDVAAKGLQLPESARERSHPLWYVYGDMTDETGKWGYSLLADGTAVVHTFTPDGNTMNIPAAVDGIPVTMIARVNYTRPDWEKSITKLVLPEGLKFIEEYAMDYCEALSQVKFPSTLEGIGDGAFRACSKLTSLDFPEGLRYIGKTAFGYCGIKKFALPSGLETIGDEAFRQHSVSNIEIPAGVKSIGNAAFAPLDAKSLKSIVFLSPKTVLGRGVFGYNDGREEYEYAHKEEIAAAGSTYIYDYQNTDYWKDYYADNTIYDVPELKVSCYPGSTADLLYQYHVKKTFLAWGEENIRTAPADRVLQAGLYKPEDLVYELIIPEGVEEIPDSAFESLATLNKVTLPQTLTKIGNRAFAGCSGLIELKLPKGVTSVGESCFDGCTNLAKINLPDGITEIPDFLFRNCTNLTKPELPKKDLTRIGNYAFDGCSSLTNLKLSYKTLTEIGEGAFRFTGLKSVTIPDSVTSLGKGAFYLSGITSLTLPEGLTEIPNDLCAYAQNLKTVKLPVELKSIGERAFLYCRLSSLTLPEGLTTIGEAAFGQNLDAVEYYYLNSNGKEVWTSLKSLKLPASLEVIGKNAFIGNDALTSLTFGKDAKLREIGDNAFCMCMNLKEIKLPDTVEKIGESGFTLCLQMKKAELGAALKEIGTGGFSFCYSLESLTVPDTLTEIGDKLLENHRAGLKVTCGEGSAAESWLKANYPDVTIVYPKKK